MHTRDSLPVLAGRHALVTGANRGIGAAIARALSVAGGGGGSAGVRLIDLALAWPLGPDRAAWPPATDAGTPFLGICVGLQMMFDASEEMGVHEGLGLLAGRVQAVPAVGSDGVPHRIPHIGWRPLERARQSWEGSVLADLQPRERVYFVHSFAAQPVDPGVRLANVDYDGVSICAAVHHGNLHGCQFHPERSALPGLAMLRRFLAL